MAKFKKKKHRPTPDPDDSKKNDESKDNEQKTPPTEKVDLPKTDPEQTEQETIRRKRKLDKLFWLRVSLAVIGGIIATFIFDSIQGEERRWASIAFMIFIFMISIGIAKNMNLRLPRSDRKKLVTTGIGSFVFLYLFSWITSYTIFDVTYNETIGMFPFP